MNIDENTKVMARLHPAVNSRGLNIYNPYFSAARVNACYLLFPNPDARRLLSGVCDLGLAGGVVAGAFETDPTIADLVDELDPLAERLGRVAFVAQRGGRLKGGYQGARGLLDSLTETGNISESDIVVLGAGTVVRGLLLLMELSDIKPRSIAVFNRNAQRADSVASEFPWIDRAGSTETMLASGDGTTFINATPIGSPWTSDQFTFTEGFVQRFETIVDVTFVPLESPLIATARKLGKSVSPGHRMFMYQARHVIEQVLEMPMDTAVFEPIMIDDFRKNWS